MSFIVCLLKFSPICETNIWVIDALLRKPGEAHQMDFRLKLFLAKTTAVTLLTFKTSTR